MANELIKMKTGLISSIEEDEETGVSPVDFEAGTIYFAVDSQKETGRIYYDVDNSHRVVMSTQAKKAETATSAQMADEAEILATPRTIDGVNFDGGANITHYEVCNTAANVAAKTVTHSGFILAAGARIIVKYANTNTASNPTLNVNNTGAKAIYYHNERIPVDALKANELHEYVYDGLNWVYVGAMDFHKVDISIDDANQTLFITSPIVNGDGVSY